MRILVLVLSCETGFRRKLAQNRLSVCIIHAICSKSTYRDKSGLAFLQVDCLFVFRCFPTACIMHAQLQIPAIFSRNPVGTPVSQQLYMLRRLSDEPFLAREDDPVKSEYRVLPCNPGKAPAAPGATWYPGFFTDRLFRASIKTDLASAEPAKPAGPVAGHTALAKAGCLHGQRSNPFR